MHVDLAAIMTLHRALLPAALPLLLAGMLAWSHGRASAGPALPHAQAATSSPMTLSSGPDWRELSAAQKMVLQPLAVHWAKMDDTGRDKWVNVANRFDKLSPAEQQRVQERMGQWARLPAQERGEARLRFQQSRQLTADERQQKWAAYQALPPEDRQDLTRQAQRKAKPVYLADGTAGPREAKQAFGGKRVTAVGNSAKKSNVVPNPVNGTDAAPTVVAPTLIKAGTGATTNLVNQRPAPPLHQHAGLPKIAASKGFVDPVTLLPKKGAQSAAMASLPSAAAAEQATRR
jgi:hypothetical protein